MLSSKNLIRILANTVIGLILIFFWFKLVNVSEVLQKLRQVELVRVLPFIFFFALSNLLRSLRLKYLLSKYKIPLKNMVSLTYLSQLLSFTIPLRVGEITKGVYLSTEYEIPFSKALVWSLLDRFLDFWSLLVLAMGLLIIIPTKLPPNFKPTLLILIVLLTAITALLVFFPKFSKKVISQISKVLILNIVKKYFTQISHFFIDTSEFLNKGLTGTLWIMILTFASLISDGVGWYLLFSAVFPQRLAFLQIQLGSLLSSLTYLIPAAPGYVGSAEASSLAVFSYILGLDKTLVSVVAVLNHGIILVCILIFGLISLYLLKFNLNLVWKKFRKESN